MEDEGTEQEGPDEEQIQERIKFGEEKTFCWKKAVPGVNAPFFRRRDFHSMFEIEALK